MLRLTADAAADAAATATAAVLLLLLLPQSTVLQVTTQKRLGHGRSSPNAQPRRERQLVAFSTEGSTGHELRAHTRTNPSNINNCVPRVNLGLGHTCPISKSRPFGPCPLASPAMAPGPSGTLAQLPGTWLLLLKSMAWSETQAHVLVACNMRLLVLYIRA